MTDKRPPTHAEQREAQEREQRRLDEERATHGRAYGALFVHLEEGRRLKLADNAQVTRTPNAKAEGDTTAIDPTDPRASWSLENGGFHAGRITCYALGDLLAMVKLLDFIGRIAPTPLGLITAHLGTGDPLELKSGWRLERVRWGKLEHDDGERAARPPSFIFTREALSHVEGKPLVRLAHPEVFPTVEAALVCGALLHAIPWDYCKRPR